MTEEQMKRIGNALIAAGQALVDATGESVSASEAATKIAATQTPTVEEKTEPKKRNKSKKTKEVEAQENAKTENTTEETQPKSNGKAEFTHDDLRKALVDFAKKNGKAKAYELLAEFGAKKAIEVPEDKLGAVFTRMEGHA